MHPPLPVALLVAALALSACGSDPVGVSDTALPAAVVTTTCSAPPARTGSIQLSSLPLSQSLELKSQNSDTPTNITFTNATCDPVLLYWIDFDGNRVLYATIPAGESYVQNTYLTHPWVVTNALGDIGLYLPVPDGANAQEAYIARRCSVRQKALPKKITGCSIGDRG